MEELHESLKFHPSWIFDPAIWKVIDIGDKAKAAQVINVQLQHTHEILAAQVKAVEGLKQIMAR